MTGHRTDGNHGRDPSKPRTLATKKSRCWRNQAITLTENLAIRSHSMSLVIALETSAYCCTRRIMRSLFSISPTPPGPANHRPSLVRKDLGGHFAMKHSAYTKEL